MNTINSNGATEAQANVLNGVYSKYCNSTDNMSNNAHARTVEYCRFVERERDALDAHFREGRIDSSSYLKRCDKFDENVKSYFLYSDSREEIRHQRLTIAGLVIGIIVIGGAALFIGNKMGIKSIETAAKTASSVVSKTSVTATSSVLSSAARLAA